MVKIENYKQLKEMFDNGTLKDWQLIMDNDSCWLEYIGKFDEDGNIPKDVTEYEFNGDGYRDIVDVCNACGINCDWC